VSFFRVFSLGGGFSPFFPFSAPFRASNVPSFDPYRFTATSDASLEKNRDWKRAPIGSFLETSSLRVAALCLDSTHTSFINFFCFFLNFKLEQKKPKQERTSSSSSSPTSAPSSTSSPHCWVPAQEAPRPRPWRRRSARCSRSTARRTSRCCTSSTRLSCAPWGCRRRRCRCGSRRRSG